VTTLCIQLGANPAHHFGCLPALHMTLINFLRSTVNGSQPLRLDVILSVLLEA